MCIRDSPYRHADDRWCRRRRLARHWRVLRRSRALLGLLSGGLRIQPLLRVPPHVPGRPQHAGQCREGLPARLAPAGRPRDCGASRAVHSRRRGAWCRVRWASSVAVITRPRHRNAPGSCDAGTLAPPLLPALATTPGGGRGLGRRVIWADHRDSPMGLAGRRLGRCWGDADSASTALPDTAGSVVALEVRGKYFRLRTAARARVALAAGAGRDILRMGGGARTLLRQPSLAAERRVLRVPSNG